MSIEKLKAEIVDGSFNERDRFIYTFIYVVLSAVGFEVGSYTAIEENADIWSYLTSTISILIICIGTVLAYKANGGKNGTDFLGKYFSIGFVIAMRFMLILIPLLAILIFYHLSINAENNQNDSLPYDMLVLLIWEFLLYVRICKNIPNYHHC